MQQGFAGQIHLQTQENQRKFPEQVGMMMRLSLWGALPMNCGYISGLCGSPQT